MAPLILYPNNGGGLFGVLFAAPGAAQRLGIIGGNYCCMDIVMKY